MANRKQFQSVATVSPALRDLLDRAQKEPVTEEDLQEQRVSFAFGNAPESELITKDTVRYASKHLRLK